MAYSINTFNQLLEQYIFSVTNDVIDLADTKTQSKLIDWIHRVNPASGPVEERLPLENGQPSASEWERVLDKSIDHQSIYNQWLICVTRDRARRQEAYIDQIRKTIQFTRQQGLLIMAQTLPKAVQLGLIHRNLAILAQQQNYLSDACQAKKVIFDQLDQLVSNRDACRKRANESTGER